MIKTTVVLFISCCANHSYPEHDIFSFNHYRNVKADLGLFSASIMSKKVAEGLDALVLEVTYGKAANMKTEQEARTLAQIMVNIIIKHLTSEH